MGIVNVKKLKWIRDGYPCTWEWMQHKAAWEHVSMGTVLDAYEEYIEESIKKEALEKIKGEELSDLISRSALLMELRKNVPEKWDADINYFICNAPTIEAVPVVHGKWILEANKENVNYRWNVVAECSKCHHELGEIWAGFFPGVPDSIAKDVALQHARNVKLGNFCSNCGADLRKNKQVFD